MSNRILALDTATEACSAAVVIDGVVVAKRFELAPRRHAELILSQLDAVLKEAGIRLQQLDALAYGCGPGAFTGVRLAASVVQGVAFAADLPVIPVSDLAALAYEAHLEFAVEHLACAIDARMGEVYWACYRADTVDGVRLLGSEFVVKPDAIPIPQGHKGELPAEGCWCGVGSGWARYAPLLQAQLAIQQVWSERFPAAAAIALLGALSWRNGNFVPAQQALPVYLRDQVAQRPAAVAGLT